MGAYSGDSRPYDPGPSGAYATPAGGAAYSDNTRPYDPAPSGAYATPAGGAAYYRSYSGDPVDAYNRPADAYNRPADAYIQPVDAYHDNQPYRDSDPMDAYKDNQPYRNDNPMDAYKDNRPYGSGESFPDSEPFASEPADAYAVSDDNPADAY